MRVVQLLFDSLFKSPVSLTVYSTEDTLEIHSAFLSPTSVERLHYVVLPPRHKKRNKSPGLPCSLKSVSVRLVQAVRVSQKLIYLGGYKPQFS